MMLGLEVITNERMTSLYALEWAHLFKYGIWQYDYITDISSG